MNAFDYSQYPEAAAFKTALLAYEQCDTTITRLISQGGDTLQVEAAQKCLNQLHIDVGYERSRLWLAIVEHGIDGETAKTLVMRFEMQVTGRIR